MSTVVWLSKVGVEQYLAELQVEPTIENQPQQQQQCNASGWSLDLWLKEGLQCEKYIAGQPGGSPAALPVGGFIP
jgi:hypothetical protein